MIEQVFKGIEAAGEICSFLAKFGCRDDVAVSDGQDFYLAPGTLAQFFVAGFVGPAYGLERFELVPEEQTDP